MLPKDLHFARKVFFKSTPSTEPSLYVQLDLRFGRISVTTQFNITAGINGTAPFHSV
ncbi:hypothetical protein LTR53_003086 [Teratosphaeriaceae sp. CCFEE 6253]|nr:hypothetical protein LTR53_003086 [Teratosphaeriaceae sp. CCFEE 6253]